jgi:putative ABC transport system ATP-binding protein
MDTTDMIRLESVTKIFRTRRGDVAALDGVALSIEHGHFVAIRGPSGCGKSTLLSLVGGLALPTAGQVVVADRAVSQMTPAERARFRNEKVGFVFQMFHLLPYLSVLDNILVAASPGNRREARARAEQLLERFQLGDRVTHRPGQLSVGQRQRVAMARALLNQPQLLLADEPTGNLDTETATGLLDLLSEFQQQGGTILLVTHDDRAAARAQRVIQMDRGRILDGQLVG